MKQHQKTHSINAIALILGIGRERLTRALADSGADTSGPLTVAQAFTALSARFETDELRRRKLSAETETAELDAAKKKGELMFKKDAALLWADATIRFRQVIQSRRKWESDKLLVALSKVELHEEDDSK
jgi:hypothetical protein